MRLSKSGNRYTTIVNKILFIEMIFVFSAAASFLILTFLKAADGGKNSLDNPKYLFKNFRIVNYFLKLDLQSQAVPVKVETEPAGSDNPLIKNILQLKTAETLFKEGKRDSIPALLDNINTKYRFINRRKRELYLKFLYAKKRYRDFITYFDSISAGRGEKTDRETQLLLINSLLKTTNQTRAFNIFKELFAANDLSFFSKKISRNELRSFLSQLTYDDWYRKFFSLVGNNDYREFLTEKKYIAAPTLTKLIDAEFFYRRKQYTRALQSLEKVTTKRLLNHKKKLLIKINLRQDNFDDVLEAVDELKKDEEIYARLLLDCAGILLTKGESELSSRFFTKYIDSGVPKDPDFYRILWITAWIHYRNNNREKAVQYFEKGSRSRFAAYKTANSYWLHRLTGKGSQNIDEHPFSYYYAKVAGNKRNNNTRQSKNFDHFISGTPSSRLPGVIEDIKLLLKAGLLDECFGFINRTKQDEQFSPTDRNILKIIESVIYLKKQNFYQAFISFRENFPNYTCIVPPGALSRIYSPVRYKGVINKYANIYDIDNMLILALIREETMFRADAISPAKANKLMQLLIGTARQITRGEGLKIRRWDLYKPEINVRLGTKYFRYLLDKYDGQAHLALAAYNAGDHRVDQWLKEFGHVGTDEFIEMIPFSETRSYVKNIIRNHYYYKYYYE
ncbi:transglycosylase SLT domain-containing protein [Acidobacteriota bacterium]